MSKFETQRARAAAPPVAERNIFGSDSSVSWLTASRATARVRAAIICAMALLGSYPATAAAPAWRATLGASHAVIFGSFHVLRPTDTAWCSSTLMQHFAETTELWMEADGAQGANANQIIADINRSRMPTDLSDVSLSDVSRAMQRVGITLRPGNPPPPPWLLSMVMSVQSFRLHGFTSANSPESVFETGATMRKMARNYLEEFPDQFEPFRELPRASEVALLADSARSVLNQEESLGRSVTAWETGNLSELETLTGAEVDHVDPGLYRGIYASRNGRWSKKIAERLRRPGNIFVVVGMGHLIGPSNLLADLRAEGVTVEPIASERMVPASRSPAISAGCPT